MILSTKAPIIYSSLEGDYSSLDAKSSHSDVKAFQNWFNITKKPSTKLVEDGVWGKNTSNAWNGAGADYKKMMGGAQKAVDSKPVDGTKPADAKSDVKPAAADETKPAEDKTKVGFIDKFKALSTPKKVAVVAIPLVVIGLVVFLIKRNK